MLQDLKPKIRQIIDVVTFFWKTHNLPLFGQTFVFYGKLYDQQHRRFAHSARRDNDNVLNACAVRLPFD
ncbi:MAG TPA: hypothetical protein VF571_08320 [Pyrinomonadaceae bacterium]